MKKGWYFISIIVISVMNWQVTNLFIRYVKIMLYAIASLFSTVKFSFKTKNLYYIYFSIFMSLKFQFVKVKKLASKEMTHKSLCLTSDDLCFGQFSKGKNLDF